MVRFQKRWFLKGGVLVCVALLALMLALCEATACGLDSDQCPMTVCCIPSLCSDNTITHELFAVPYSPLFIPAAAKQFLSAIFHPPRT